MRQRNTCIMAEFKGNNSGTTSLGPGDKKGRTMVKFECLDLSEANKGG